MFGQRSSLTPEPGSLRMAMENLQDLFEHELEDIYSAEHMVLDTLKKLATGTQDDSIAQAFRDHREETQGQIDRLERVFEQINKQPSQEECEGIKGLATELDEMLNSNPSPAVKNVINLMAADKTEHYEIAAYGNLAKLASELGLDEAGDLLHENLEEEKAALEKLSQHVDDFDFEVVQGAASAD